MMRDPIIVPPCPPVTTREKMNTNMLRWLIANPKEVCGLTETKDDVETEYSNLCYYANSVGADGKVEMEYRQASYGVGCLFATKPSLQRITRPIRHAVTKGELYDNDMINAAPTIWDCLARRHGIDLPLLQQYVNDREPILARLMEHEDCDRDAAKQMILKVLNRGNTSSTLKFMKDFKAEARRGGAELVKLYPKYKGINPDADYPAASDIALLIADMQNWCLMVAKEYLQEYGVSVMCIDGFMTEKQVPADILEACSRHVQEVTELTAVFAEKPIAEPRWKVDTRKLQLPNVYEHAFKGYAVIKERFEADTFKLMNPICYVQTHGETPIIRSEAKMKEAFRNKYYRELNCILPQNQPPAKKRKGGKEETERLPYATIFRKELLKDWLDDEEIRTHATMDFYPPPVAAPRDAYNTWNGFAVEREVATEEDKREMEAWIIPFLKEVICGDVVAIFTYLVNWLANMFQSPGAKSRTGCVLLGDEGCGKNRLTELLRLMIGDAMFFKTSELGEKVFSRFSNVALYRLLMVGDEITPTDMNNHYNAMMDLITSEKLGGEFKGVGQPFNYANHLRAIFTSNEGPRLLKIRDKDRKYQFFSVSGKRRGQVKEYFEPLMARIESPGVRRAFYDYLLSVDIGSFNFETQRVETEEYRASKMLSVRKEIEFLHEYILAHPEFIAKDTERVGPLIVETKKLFSEFNEYIKRSGMGKCTEYSSSTMSFGMLLGKTPGFVKNPHHGAAASYFLHPEPLIDFLIQQGLMVAEHKQWWLNMPPTTNGLGGEDYDRWLLHSTTRRDISSDTLTFDQWYRKQPQGGLMLHDTWKKVYHALREDRHHQSGGGPDIICNIAA